MSFSHIKVQQGPAPCLTFAWSRRPTQFEYALPSSIPKYKIKLSTSSHHMHKGTRASGQARSKDM
eukprot:scaffold1128_cov94-Cylindrotheca_fusiformis.AAC.2